MKTMRLRRSMAGVLTAGVLGVVGAAAGGAFTGAQALGAGTPINIMAEAPNGTSSTNEPDFWYGAQAAAADINAHGGINGHPLNVILCNDNQTAAGEAACAQQAPGQNVVAGMGLNLGLTSNLWQQNKIAQIGTTQPLSADSDPNNWPIYGGPFMSLASGPLALKADGIKSIATVSYNLPSTASFVAAIKATARAAGIPYKGAILVPATPVPDYTSYALALKNLGAQGVVFVTNISILISFKAAAESVGFTNMVPVISGASVDDFVASTIGDAANGLIVPSALPPVSDTKQYPALKKYVADSLKINPFQKHGLYGEQAWLFTYGLAAVAKTIKGPVTNLSFLKALHTWPKGKTIDLQGIIKWDPNAKGPAIMPRVGQGKIWVSKVVNDRLVLVGNKPVDFFKVLKGKL